jgi:hypothetical protein
MMESTGRNRRLQFRVNNEGAFLVALALLVAVAVGARRYGWVVKKPVPWPETVIVNEANRMESMPGFFGPAQEPLFVAVTQRDHEIFDRGGREGADTVFPDDVLETLGVRLPRQEANESRLADRTGNWYASRTYRDTRPNAPFRYWQVDVYYYTGLKDQVPHVPGICLVAGGAEDLAEQFMKIPIPGVFDGESMMFVATTYEIVPRMDQPSQDGVEYFVFIFNGEPVKPGKVEGLLSFLIGLNKSGQLRKRVREDLASLDTYNYFAKVQLSPLGRGNFEVEEANAAARELIEAAMPEIVKLLPSAQDVKALEAQE